MSVPAALTYGSGVVSVVVSGGAPPVQGTVTLLDGGTVLGRRRWWVVSGVWMRVGWVRGRIR